uniref:Putative secreted protein n=1 Tax=Anopheles darlingi TaxID=43151 RepID=A0A2M4DMJ2_ANODA
MLRANSRLALRSSYLSLVSHCLSVRSCSATRPSLELCEGNGEICSDTRPNPHLRQCLHRTVVWPPTTMMTSGT